MYTYFRHVVYGRTMMGIDARKSPRWMLSPRERSQRRTGYSPQRHEGHEGKSPILLSAPWPKYRYIFRHPIPVGGPDVIRPGRGSASPLQTRTCNVRAIHQGVRNTAPNLRHRTLGDLCALVLNAFLLPLGRKRPVSKSHKEIRVISQSLCGLVFRLLFRGRRVAA